MIAARYREPAIALLIFVAAMLWFQQTLHTTLELRDEGYLLYQIERVADGEIPHHDFDETYGPGVYALTAPVFAFFGERVLPLRELIAAFKAAAVLFAYLLARHFVPRAFALQAAAIAAAFWGWSIWTLATPYASLFTIPLCMGSLVMVLESRARERPGLLFAAGVVGGSALLFKWTLAAIALYGIVLAICADEMSRNESEPRNDTGRGLVLAVWGLLAGVLVLPFASRLTPWEYALHFLPIHGLMALVALGFARSGDGAAVFRRSLPLVLRYTAGALLAPLLVAAFYASIGSLDRLVVNTLLRPFTVPNYPLPVPIPDGGSLALLGALVLAVTSALLILRRCYRRAGISAGLCLVLTPIALAPLQAQGLAHTLARLNLQTPALLLLFASALLAASFRRAKPGDAARSALVAALLFQGMMTFQIYPRGGYNVSLMLGTLAPASAWLAWRGYALATGGPLPAGATRRAAAFALVTLIPLAYVYDRLAYAATAPSARETPERALAHPALAGIHPKPAVMPQEEVDAFNELTSVLDRIAPHDAPLYVLHNEPIFYFLSERPPLFQDHIQTLFLMGWELWPLGDPTTPSARDLVRLLDAHPETIILTRRDEPSARVVLRNYPPLRRHISDHYHRVAQVGDYRILRRREAR